MVLLSKTLGGGQLYAYEFVLGKRDLGAGLTKLLTSAQKAVILKGDYETKRLRHRPSYTFQAGPDH